jgi:deoxyribodipyrimidine photo-lyase
MSAPAAIVWFRNDLRLTDNPALPAAIAGGGRVIAVYVWSPQEEAPWSPGDASRWWLHHSLDVLAAQLAAAGSRLLLRRGPAAQALAQLVHETGASQVHANGRCEPVARQQEKTVAQALQMAGARLDLHDGGLLLSPPRLHTAAGTPFRRFTPFWQALQVQLTHEDLSAAPDRLPTVPQSLASEPFTSLGLLPRHDWAGGLTHHWQPGEAGAHRRLQATVESVLPRYATARDRPDQDATSRLSPHLHFGEISPRRVLAALEAAAGDSPALDSQVAALWREIGWREFSAHLLWHYPTLPQEPLDERFAAFPWHDDPERLHAWQRGRTGVPLVDAGMRELWHTGFMHNRVRMITASFLTKHLLQPWQAGARWFWDTLVDADLASNSQNWQWVAGCGADAAPYFRVFNPVLQGHRFDPEGDYVRRWVPELASLSKRHLHAPWQAPESALRAAGVRLGETYPRPIVDLATGRQTALAAYAQTRGATGRRHTPD